MWRQPRAGHGRLPLSAREGPVSATTFVAHSSDPRVVGTLVGVEATPLQNPDSPRREFSAHILPMPGSPRAGFGGVPGVRVPAKHHYHSPAGAQMDPLWSPPKGGKGVNAPFSKGACTLCSPPPRPAVGSIPCAHPAPRLAAQEPAGTCNRRMPSISRSTSKSPSPSALTSMTCKGPLRRRGSTRDGATTLCGGRGSSTRALTRAAL